MPAVTKNGVAPKTHLNEAPKKEDSSITFYSSTSNSDVDDAPFRFDDEQGVVPLAGFSGYEKNLEKENERLQKLVLEYDRQLAEIARTENAIIGTTEINEDEPLSSKRLKGKIQSLKAKRREEKIRCMQLQKSVETHSAEIEGLQRELNRSLNDLDQLALSRRGLLRSSAWLGAGAALSAIPFAEALAQASAEASVDGSWPTVAAMLDKYVATRKIPGMVAALGWGKAAPGYIRRGTEGFDDPCRANRHRLTRFQKANGRGNRDEDETPAYRPVFQAGKGEDLVVRVACH